MLRKYNALFILPATFGDDDVEKVMKTVEETVAQFNGRVPQMRMLGKRPFARPLKKHETGFYAKMQIEIEPGSIDALLAKLKLNEDVFRVQILRDESPAVQVTKPVQAAEPVQNEEENNG